MSDDAVTQNPADDTHRPAGPPVWTARRVLALLVVLACLGVTVGLYLYRHDLDPSIVAPEKAVAIAVFAIVGGIGYRLSGKLGERMLIVIAVLSAAAIVLLAIADNYELDPAVIRRGHQASTAIIAVVFALTGLCIFGGWIYFGFFRKHPPPRTAD